MRFAYIDSQGNEVPIPSVDALALRIELGAIGPDTQLYDEQADHWAPAEAHEIFHTLSRAKDEEGFVAPPPVPPASGSEDGEQPAAEEPAAEEPAAEEPVMEMSADELAPDVDGLTAESDRSSIFDLSEEGSLAGEGEDLIAAAEEEAEASEGLGFDLDLSPTESSEPVEEPEAPGDDLAIRDDLGADLVDAPANLAPEHEDEEEGGSFDFGEMGSLELEAPAVEEEEGAEEEEATMAFGGGMDMEEALADSMDFASTGDEIGGADLELEAPMSDFGTDSSPAWMEESGPGAAEQDAPDSMDFAQPAAAETPAPAEGEAAAAEDDEDSLRRRPEPRSRPSPPKRRTKSKVPMIVGVVAVVGVGGFFGWKALSSRSSGPDREEQRPQLPEVVIPDIPAELLPTMRDLAEAALADMLAELSGMHEAFALPPEPRNDWLSGAYLGTASQFGDLEQYWLGIESFVDSVRAVDTQIFHEMYVAQVEAAGIAADTAAMLVERADSGFLAARADRFEAYNQMDDLVNAALDLHAFLVDNEADITYEPAAGGISRDPVLEAIPSSSALGDEMWGMVDNITDALDNLGTLDRVTTERLFAVLFDRIRRAGVQ